MNAPIDSGYHATRYVSWWAEPGIAVFTEPGWVFYRENDGAKIVGDWGHVHLNDCTPIPQDELQRRLKAYGDWQVINAQAEADIDAFFSLQEDA